MHFSFLPQKSKLHDLQNLSLEVREQLLNSLHTSYGTVRLCIETEVIVVSVRREMCLAARGFDLISRASIAPATKIASFGCR